MNNAFIRIIAYLNLQEKRLTRMLEELHAAYINRQKRRAYTQHFQCATPETLE